MSPDSNSRSRFAMSLASLLDDTNLFTRAEWAEFLVVSEAAMSQWVHDKTLPRAHVLRQILRVLHESDDIPKSVLADFWDMAGARASDVTPLNVRAAGSIGEYMVIPIRNAFLDSLSGLNSGTQDGVLRIGASLCSHRVVPDEMFENKLASKFDNLFKSLSALEPSDRDRFLSQTVALAEGFQHYPELDEPTSAVLIDFPRDRHEQSFVLSDGTVRRVNAAGERQSSGSDVREFAARLRQVSSALTSSAPKPTPALAAADPLRRGLSSTNSPYPLIHPEDVVSDDVECCVFRGDKFITSVLVSPQSGRFNVEVFVADENAAPITDGIVHWRYRNRDEASRIIAGHAWITRAGIGDLGLTIKLPSRAEQDIALHFS